MLAIKTKYIFTISICTLSILLLSQGCASFKPLSTKVDKIDNISGIYYNDCIEDDTLLNGRIGRLWSQFDYKNEISEDSLFVKIEIRNPKKLHFQLINKDGILVEKNLKGEFREDNCFYTRRCFYIIPILPIIWAYSNEQERLYVIDDVLTFETTYNKGGCLIIMAGGTKDDYKQNYKKKNNNSR